MGSRPSKVKKQPDTSQYGKIFLQTDKTVYSAGDTVTGTVFLDLISPYPGNQLFLKFKGKEVAHVVQGYEETIDTPDGPITVTHYRKGSDKHKIINQSQTLHSWEKLFPSQFSFPFSFLIPRYGIPGSFYQQGTMYLAFIEYQVEAFLQPFNKNQHPKMKYKQPLRIKDQFFLNPRNLLLRTTTVLKTCCCFKRGSSTLKASFTKDSYSHGEKAEVLVEVDNSNTKLEPKQIKFCLVQRLSIHAGGHHFFNSFKRAKVKQTFAEKNIPSEVKARSLFLTIPPFATEADFKRKIDKYKPSKSALMGLPEFKGGITSPTRGRFVNSEFYLQIKCSTTGCCTTSPYLSFPIFICLPDLELPALPLPSNWQPEPSENKVIEISLSKIKAHENINGKQKQQGDKIATNSMTGIEISTMCLPELPPNQIEDRQNP